MKVEAIRGFGGNISLKRAQEWLRQSEIGAIFFYLINSFNSYLLNDLRNIYGVEHLFWGTVLETTKTNNRVSRASYAKEAVKCKGRKGNRQ